MRLHAITHVPYETSGRIASWAAAGGHDVQTSRLFAGDPLPAPGTFDWLVVMGGPMGVHDESTCAWLADEKRCLERAVRDGCVVLGICLGAQLLAHVLGAAVSRNAEREIGWFPVRRTADAKRSPLFADWPDPLDVLHWHDDTFAMPAGAVHAWSSEACANQAFSIDDRLVALQFHLEMTRDRALELTREGAATLAAGGRYVQDAATILDDAARFEQTHANLYALLDRMAAMNPVPT